MKKFFIFLSFAGCFACATADKGFKINDLREVAIDVSAFHGGEFLPRAEQDRLSLLCLNCGGNVTGIDISLGRSNDETESRYRSGETTIGHMEKLCQSRSPTCKLKAVEVGGAVGWLTEYSLSETMMGSTLVLFKDGDLLTIRSIGPTRNVSDINADTAIELIAPLIVGE